MAQLRAASVILDLERQDTSTHAGHTVSLIRNINRIALLTYANMRLNPPLPDSLFSKCFREQLVQHKKYDVHCDVVVKLKYTPHPLQYDAAIDAKPVEVGRERIDFFVTHFAENKELASCCVVLQMLQDPGNGRPRVTLEVALERGWRAANSLSCEHCVVICFEKATRSVEVWLVNREGRNQKL